MTLLEDIIFFILFFGAATLPPLVSTLVFAVWLPRVSKKWKIKLLCSALLSATVMLYSQIYYTTLFVPFSYIIQLSDWTKVLFFLILLASPIVVIADLLLYYGGKAIHLHLSKGRVAFGYIRVVLGLLFLPVALILVLLFVVVTVFF